MGLIAAARSALLNRWKDHCLQAAIDLGRLDPELVGQAEQSARNVQVSAHLRQAKARRGVTAKVFGV